jgi:hypothetical protein
VIRMEVDDVFVREDDQPVHSTTASNFDQQNERIKPNGQMIRLNALLELDRTPPGLFIVSPPISMY